MFSSAKTCDESYFEPLKGEESADYEESPDYTESYAKIWGLEK